jgi:hypothetical protein
MAARRHACGAGARRAGTDGACVLRAGAGTPVDVNGADPSGVVVDDFNGDKRPDVVTINGTSSNISVLLRQPIGGFVEEPGSPVGVGTGPNFGAVADFNGDGRPDVAVSARVVVRCKGRGCPFKGPRSFGRRKSTVSLTKAFRNERLRAGAVIEIAISAPGRIGAVRRYRVRGGPRRLKPKASTLCLPEGTSRPRRTC